MKKVLLIAPMSSVHERFNIANFMALESLGFEVSVIADFSLSAHDKQYKNELELKGIKVYDFPFARASFFKNLKVIPQIKKVIRENKFDIIHSHTETGGILTRLAMSADRKTKYFFTPHGMSFYKGSSVKSQLIYRPIEFLICSRMDKVLCINEEEFQTVKGWKKKNEVFVHGIGLNLDSVINAQDKSAEIKAQFGITNFEKIILSVGELNDNKNHATCIKAISKLAEKPTYMVCGEGNKAEELKKLADELGVKLILTGYRYDVKSFYHIADVFAFPSYHEGLAVSMLEAMAAGLPIVCSRIRGNTDIIVHGEGGCLCEPDSTEQFAKAFKFYLSNENEIKKAGEINQQNAKLYSLYCVTEELKKIYKTE